MQMTVNKTVRCYRDDSKLKDCYGNDGQQNLRYHRQGSRRSVGCYRNGRQHICRAKWN